MAVRDVLIVGAGPSGLATAIAAKQHGLDYAIVEKGVLVNSIFNFPMHMVFFTTPELLEIGGLPLVTPYDKPTRLEALRYYRRVVDTYNLQIAFHEEVLAIEREEGMFAVTTRAERGVRRVRHARAVVLAIGYYDLPNDLGVPGEDLPHVSHYYTDAHPYYRQRVVVVGGKNSAAEAALELFRGGAHVTLVHRHATLGDSIKYWVRPDIENRIKEGSIAARFNARVSEIRSNSVVVETSSNAASADDEAARQRELFADADASHAPAVPVASPGAERGPVVDEIGADAVYLLTGYRTDADLLCRAGVRLNDREAPIHNAQTFETNVPGLFVAGGAIAGVDTGTVFIENGRFHGEKIIEEIARRAGA